MAIIECPECRKGVSDRAAQCPHCGFPIKKEAAPPPPLKPKFECPECHKEVSDRAAQCPHCGFPTKKKAAPPPLSQPRMVFCRGCGQEIHASALVCPRCGAAQQGKPRAEGSTALLVCGYVFAWLLPTIFAWFVWLVR